MYPSLLYDRPAIRLSTLRPRLYSNDGLLIEMFSVIIFTSSLETLKPTYLCLGHLLTHRKDILLGSLSDNEQ